MGCEGSSPESLRQNQACVKNRRLKTIDARKGSSKASNEITENVSIRDYKLSESEVQMAYNYLKNHTIFDGLCPEDLKNVCKKFQIGQTPKGQFLFKQGDTGSCFFVIVEGEVQIHANDEIVNTLSKGATFGQIALLLKCKRTASIKCVGQKNLFLLLRPGVYRGTVKEVQTARISEDRKIWNKVQIFSFLNNKEKFILSQISNKIRYQKGMTIFNHGEPSNSFYVILEGSVKIQVPQKETVQLSKYQSFGEAGLVQNRHRAGKAVANEKTLCAVFLRSDLQKSLDCDLNNIIFFNSKKWSLMQSSIFNSLSEDNLNKIILQFEIKFASNKEVILNDNPSGFYIVLEGKIQGLPQGSLLCQQFWTDEKKMKKITLRKQESGFYCFLSFQKLRNLFKLFNQKGKKAPRRVSSNIDVLPQTLMNYQYLKKLGQGQFGTVYLIRDINNKTVAYALKCLKKKQIKREEMESSVIEERNILNTITFPYICGFMDAFEDSHHIYLMMEYIKGQDLFDVIREINHLSQPIIKYYFGSLLLSTEHLHSHNIIYRDLKPENSIVNYQGKVYMIDLGTAKFLSEETSFKTYTIIGTPHYMAPEVFKGTGYSLQVDIWTLGVILYQFACERLPFGQQCDGQDPFEVYSCIKKGKVKFPNSLRSLKLKEVILNMLVKDPSERAISGKLSKVKQMQYFKGFSWQQLLLGQMKSPYIPKAFQGGQSKAIYEMKGKPLFQKIYGNSKVQVSRINLRYWNGKFD